MLFLTIAGLVFFRDIPMEGKASFFLFVDGWEQFYPWLFKVCQSWGRYLAPPLWDFTSYSGISFIGELQTAPLYPLTLLRSIGSPVFCDRKASRRGVFPYDHRGKWSYSL
jgi:hypothetical protein